MRRATDGSTDGSKENKEKEKKMKRMRIRKRGRAIDGESAREEGGEVVWPRNKREKEQTGHKRFFSFFGKQAKQSL